jgi:hypothetical protein
MMPGPRIPAEATVIDLGTAVLSPNEPLVAGSFTTVTLTFTAGHPVDDSGYLKVVFRNVSDFGALQFTEPSQPNYCTLNTTGDCRLVPRWDEKGHIRPWNRSLFIQISGGYLDRGRRITVTFGDRSEGSPGWMVQTFRTEAFEFKTLVDPIGSYQFKELPVSPQVPIVAGNPDHAVCLAPSQVASGAPFTYFLRTEDPWGNPTRELERFEHTGFKGQGVRTVTAVSRETGLQAVSNPIEVREDRPQSGDLHRFWADFHGQSEETVGTGSIEEYFRFARDFGRLDICGHQGNDFQVSDAFWDKVNRTTARFNEPGRFVTFPGYEWSGNTPLGGDRNVLFSSEGGLISRSCRELLPGGRSRYPDSPTAQELFTTLRKNIGTASDGNAQDTPLPFVFAHAGGRYADLAMHDEQIEVAVEVHSAWGTFQWLVDDALSRGYRIGIVANSDGHNCRPGSSYPGAGKFGSLGGLTCVLAERLNRESIYKAVKARRFYATTGNRPLLSLSVDGPDGRTTPMGGILEPGHSSAPLQVRAAFTGTAPLERVEIRNGVSGSVVLRPYGADDLGSRIKILWSGAEVKGRARRAGWNGRVRVEGNRILGVEPINFWNPLQPVRSVGKNVLSWHSFTTGGVAGIIIELEDPESGQLEISTDQGNMRCPVSDICLEATTREFGGLRQRLEGYRLPDRPWTQPFMVSLALDRGAGTEGSEPGGELNLHSGSNPIYLHAVQEDGHMAWSSPIFLILP